MDGMDADGRGWDFGMEEVVCRDDLVEEKNFF
jgi:hypothetical protein